MIPKQSLFFVCFLLLFFWGECGAKEALPPLKRPYPEKLSAWSAFSVSSYGGGKYLKIADGALPYDLNNSLFADYAQKLRTLWVPAGVKSASYRGRGVFEFPVGTVFSKTFFFPKSGIIDLNQNTLHGLTHISSDGLSLNDKRLIETRILVHTESGWVGLPYIWNEEQTEASLRIEGDRVPVDLIRGTVKQTISYLVPNMNQCLSCHMNFEKNAMTPIGPQARHLNKSFRYPEGVENQLIKWVARGFLSGVPKGLSSVPRDAVWSDATTGDLNARARAYLDINCAHCHNASGSARSSGLYLSDDIVDRETLGLLKRPVASGPGSGNLYYDIMPGVPDQSILFFRMASVQPKVVMPEIGRTIVDEEGLAVIRDWITQLK